MAEESIREIQELRLLLGSPRDPDGRVFAQLGNALRRAGELDEAAEVLSEGLEAHPLFTPGHLTLGWVAVERGDLEDARTRFTRTLELDPENPFALLGLGRILELVGDDTGSAMVEQALELHPTVEALSPSLPGEDPGFFRLPFLPLADLAPEEIPDAGESLHGLPFVSLDELAPSRKRQEDLSALPFMSLWDLRPEESSDEGWEEGEEAGVASGAPADPSAGEGAEADRSPDEPGEQPSEEAVEGAGEEAFEEAFEGASEEAVEGAGEEPGGGPGAEGDLEDATEETVQGEVEGDATPVTRTMAELLVRQGLLDRALEVYHRLEEQHPGDSELERRIGEVEALRSALGAEPDSGGHTLGSPPAAPALPREGDSFEAEAHELHPSISVPEPVAETPSPYAWHGEGEELVETPPPEASAGAYFGRLLAWTPGKGTGEDETRPESDPPPGSGTDEP
ncbi:MAG: tetratricopeptide repeat protein [Gemmatimonadales bacterium]|nr:MAG: tetratricopeptide repeat protein [Gemmatimonadales bacterium]